MEEKKKHAHFGHRERLKNRFLTEGLDGFEEHNALELMLFYAVPQMDTNNLAHDLIAEFGSLSGVLDAPYDALKQVKGVGDNTATLIKLMPALFKRYAESKAKTAKLVVDSPKTAGEFFVSKYVGVTNEVCMALFTDNACKVKKCAVISEGSLNKTDLDMRKVAQLAFNLNATGIILAHNHPNGVAAPSAADIEATRHIISALRMFELRVNDHIIVSGGDYFSMADSHKFKDMFRTYR